MQAWQLGELTLYQYDIPPEIFDTSLSTSTNGPINAEFAGDQINKNASEILIGLDEYQALKVLARILNLRSA